MSTYSYKHNGYTLLELMIATVLSSIILFLAYQFMYTTLSRITKSSNKQDILEAQILQIQSFDTIKNKYSIDINSYFIHYGPDINTCPTFDKRHINGITDMDNTRSNRTQIVYKQLLWWDMDSDDRADVYLPKNTPEGTINTCYDIFIPPNDNKIAFIKDSNNTYKLHFDSDKKMIFMDDIALFEAPVIINNAIFTLINTTKTPHITYEIDMNNTIIKGILAMDRGGGNT